MDCANYGLARVLLILSKISGMIIKGTICRHSEENAVIVGCLHGLTVYGRRKNALRPGCPHPNPWDL